MAYIRLLLIVLLATDLASGQFFNLRTDVSSNILTNLQNAMTAFANFNPRRGSRRPGGSGSSNNARGSATPPPFPAPGQIDSRTLIANNDGTYTVDVSSCMLEQRVTISNHQRLGGTFISGIERLPECFSECRDTFGCVAIDFNHDFDECFLHTTPTILDSNGVPLGLRPTGCCSHAYVACAEDIGLIPGNNTGNNTVTQPTLTTVSPDCQYIALFGYVRTTFATPDLTISSTAITLDVCKTTCKTTAGCVAVDWNQSTGTCVGYTSPSHSAVLEPQITTNLVNNTCCVHCYVVCPEPPEPTTERPTTPEVPVFEPDDVIPGESGICPDPVGRVDNANLGGGSVQTGTFSSMSCKNLCLASSTCVAADFNKFTLECYTHTSIDETMYDDDNSCCVHFRKTFCDQSRCFSHSDQTVELTDPTAVDQYGDITDRSLTALSEVDCEDGRCFTRSQTFTFLDPTTGLFRVFKTSSRGCQAGSTTGRKTCVEDGDDALECYCEGILCNAVSPEGIQNCLGYYPLDMDADDRSGQQRDGVAEDVRFGNTDAQKGQSAFFDGEESYIRFRDYQNYALGQINSISGGIQPNFAVGMWIKRSTTTGDMVVLSNGIQDAQSFEIQSTMQGSSHIIIGTVKILGTTHTVAGLAPVDAWQFIVLSVSSRVGGVVIQLYTTDNALDTATPDSMNSDPGMAATQVPIDYGDDFVLGAKPMSYSFDGSITATSHFMGYIDDVYFFRGQVSIDTWRAIRISAN